MLDRRNFLVPDDDTMETIPGQECPGIYLVAVFEEGNWMLRYWRKPKRKGQTLIEFALVFPALLLLTLGILEVGRFFWVSNAVSHASREGARAAVVIRDLRDNDERVKEVVLKALKNAALSTEGVKVTSNQATVGGELVKVRVNFPYKWLTPLANFILAKNLPQVRREVEMRYEGTAFLGTIPPAWSPPSTPRESPEEGLPWELYVE